MFGDSLANEDLGKKIHDNMQMLDLNSKSPIKGLNPTEKDQRVYKQIKEESRNPRPSLEERVDKLLDKIYQFFESGQLSDNSYTNKTRTKKKAFDMQTMFGIDTKMNNPDLLDDFQQDEDEEER